MVEHCRNLEADNKKLSLRENRYHVEPLLQRRQQVELLPWIVGRQQVDRFGGPNARQGGAPLRLVKGGCCGSHVDGGDPI